jgi:hypothetical protein
MKKTIKRRLVEHMLANGNSFKYTDMIKWIVENVCKEKYDWRVHRGWYSDNFHRGSYETGYMVNGGGDCTIYKCEVTGMWKAKVFKREDIIRHKVANTIKSLSRSISRYETIRIQEKSVVKGISDIAWDKRQEINYKYNKMIKHEESKSLRAIMRAYQKS